MSDYWLIIIVVGGVVALPYTYLVFKFAGRGWVAGIRGYLRSTYERNKRNG